LLEQIGQFEQQLREYPGVFNWKVHNELRHLYGATNLRKSMEHSNIILEHSLMDDYILNIEAVEEFEAMYDRRLQGGACTINQE